MTLAALREALDAFAVTLAELSQSLDAVPVLVEEPDRAEAALRRLSAAWPVGPPTLARAASPR